MGGRYKQLYDGDWYFPARKGRSACCDCGLVHDEDIRLVRAPNGGRTVAMRLTRNRRATAAKRRALGIKIVKLTRKKREQ